MPGVCAMREIGCARANLFFVHLELYNIDRPEIVHFRLARDVAHPRYPRRQITRVSPRISRAIGIDVRGRFCGIPRHLHESNASMGPEANIDAIRALERRIEEGKGDIIKLKRDRNSLLNISTRVPPEILGGILVWSLCRENSWCYEGLQEGSYNFLLVCHHWFEVASHTPELWSFWGSTLQDWKKRHHRSGSTPLDLVLNGDISDPDVFFDEFLQGAVKSRVMQDTIRKVHLLSSDGGTLARIIASLTPDDGGGQNENIESIVWENNGRLVVDISNFFARSRLSKLRSLDLYGRFRVSSWDHLASRTTLLTTLSLDISTSLPSPTPSSSRLFSILASNPNLQGLTLANAALPDDVDESQLEVQLLSLEILSLTGEFRPLFGLLRQLKLPETLDDLDLVVSNPTVEDISQTLTSYMGEYFRRDLRFQDRLGVTSSSRGFISITVGVVHTQIALLPLEPPRVSLAINGLPPPNDPERSFINLIKLIPQERVVFFDSDLDTASSEEIFFTMPNIETLHLSGLCLSDRFLQPNPDGPHANRKLFPSLRLLRLEDVIYLNDEDWSSVITYLAHQTSDGQTISLEVVGDFPDGYQGVVDWIRGLVKEFTHRQHPVTEEDAW